MERPLKYPPVYTPQKLAFTQQLVRTIYRVVFIPFVFKIWKYVLHLLTGRSEIERYLHYPTTAGWRALHVYNSLSVSKQLPDVASKLNSTTGESLDIESLLNRIVSAKRMNTSPKSVSLSHLHSALKCIQDENAFISAIIAERQIKYDTANPEHEKRLESLWEALRPGVRRTGGRLSADWQEIGFQSHDPATDFRGAGLLGLNNLVDFAQLYPKTARQILDGNNLPIGITGLQITALLSQWLLDGRLKQHFLLVGSEKRQFVRLYAYIFFALWKRFPQQEMVKNIMAFPPIWAQFCSELGDWLEWNRNCAFYTPILSQVPLEEL